MPGRPARPLSVAAGLYRVSIVPYLEAGAVGLEIEAVPYGIGRAVDEAVSIFTFSIGAGSPGTCQSLAGYDLIDAFDTFKPKFAKRYGNIREIATEAFDEYAEKVRAGVFPDEDHCYRMKPEEAAKFAEALIERAVMPTAAGRGR